MKRAGDVKWSQVQIGAVLAVAIAFLLWASMKGGDANYWFAEKHRVHAFFFDVKGLVEGAPVKVNGVEVGTVERISWEHFADQHKLEVVATVNRHAWKYMRTDTQASVVGIGFFGDKFLGLTAGSPDRPQLGEDGVLSTNEAPDFFEALNTQSGSVNRMVSLVAHLDSLASLAASGQGTVGKMVHSSQLYDELTGMASQVRQLAGALETSQARAVATLERTGGSVDTLARDLRGGSLGAAMRDSTLYVNLRSVSGRMDSLLAAISSGQGSLGRATRDASLYVEMDSTMKEVHRIMKDFQQHPKKYLKVSVF